MTVLDERKDANTAPPSETVSSRAGAVEESENDATIGGGDVENGAAISAETNNENNNGVSNNIQSALLLPASNANTTTTPTNDEPALRGGEFGGGGGEAEIPPQEEESESERMWRKWRESPFAVGLTKATWADDDIGCYNTCSACCSGSKLACVYCTACVCSRLGTGRVGNMVVFRQTMHDVEVVDAEGNTRRIQRPRLRCVVGPYWMVTAFATMPIFLVLSVAAFSRLFNNVHWAVILVWAIVTFGLFFSLFQVACSDPGIHYRHATRPVVADNANNRDEEWIWNDQALSYRPNHAKFDPETACIVNHFDHTCPWTGTAIGGGNILWFYMFLFFTFLTLFFDIILIVFIGGMRPV